jgi:putative endonuclease
MDVVLDRHGKAMKEPCVYILASGMRGTLYFGVTSDLVKRVWQHRNDLVPGFATKYRVHDLVWFEQHPTMESAIRREKALKEWHRMWKIRMVEESNPTWADRFDEIIGAKMDPGLRRDDDVRGSDSL